MKFRMGWMLARVVMGLVLGLAPGAGANVPPAQAASAVLSWPTISLVQAASGLSSVVAMAHADDGSGRLYIVEQAGTIRVLQDRTLQAGNFLDIHARLTCCGERGLLGLAFPPNYAVRKHFYVYYTDLSGNLVIARFNASADLSQGDAASETKVITIPHPTYSNHNGGQLAFGPDGYLYSGHGDGGSGGDPDNHGQSLNTLLGKVLRLDVEGVGCVQSPPAAQNYCIPASNPFTSTAGARGEIWAYGLRNPWRFSFDRQTGELYIGDVGQGVEEEIDVQAAGFAGGANYGWRIREGNLCYNPSSGCVNPPGYVAPVSVYDHVNGNCAVTGGYVYRGPAIFQHLNGVYLYADYCSGALWGLQFSGTWASQALGTAGFAVSSFGEDENGFLYLADYNGGKVYQVFAAPDPAVLNRHLYLALAGG